MKHTLALLFLTAAAALAADVKVSELPAASTLTGTELFQVVQTNSKKATAAQVAEYANTLGAALFEAHTDKLTNFSALADAAGLFKSDGAGNYSWLGMAATGLLGDAGKVVLYGNSGQLTANSNVRVVNGTAYTQITSNGVSGSKSGNLIYVNWPGSLTGFRTITWPDASGVVHVVGQALGTPASGTLTNCTGLPPAGVVGTAAILGANTFTGAQNLTANGALSAPVIGVNGTWITGGTATTTKPAVLIEPTGATSTAWSTAGTGLGINAATGFTGNVLDVQIDGTRYFSVASGVMNLRASEIRVCNNSPIYFGPTQAVDIGMQRVSAAAMILNSPGGASAWRIAGNGGGSGSTMWVSIGHDGTNGVLTTGSTGGNISVLKPFSFPSGSNARAGNATLVGGTVTVSNNTVTANTLVILTRKTAGGTIDDLTYTLSAGTSFTITSASGTDTSTVTYLLIENP